MNFVGDDLMLKYQRQGAPRPSVAQGSVIKPFPPISMRDGLSISKEDLNHGDEKALFLPGVQQLPGVLTVLLTNLHIHRTGRYNFISTAFLGDLNRVEFASDTA